MFRILSNSVTAWSNYIPAFLTVMYRNVGVFLLPVGVYIDSYVTIGSYVLSM